MRLHKLICLLSNYAKQPTGRHNELRPIPTAIYKRTASGITQAAYAFVPFEGAAADEVDGAAEDDDPVEAVGGAGAVGLHDEHRSPLSLSKRCAAGGYDFGGARRRPAVSADARRDEHWRKRWRIAT